jgi:hypothetical protein
MTIPARHFDHTVTVWGSADVRGSTFGDVSREWSQVPGQSDIRIAIQTRRETRQDGGPGERVVGEYVGFGHASMDVIEGDVIEVISGPEAHHNEGDVRLLKVDSAYKPRGRHMQLVLIHWPGELS